MAKYFIVSDVHSYYEQLQTALTESGFDINNQSHIFVSLGDLCDRGPDAVKCLEFVNSLPKNRKILIKGNHEDLMMEALNRRFFASHDYHNRTHDTVYQVTGLCNEEEAIEAMRNNELWNTYYNSCVDYFEDDKHIFVHGWIPISYQEIEDETYNDLPVVYRPTEQVYNPNWRKATWDDEWKEARWLNGMKMWQKGIREPNKTIYCGHYHTSWGHCYLHNKGVEWPDEFAQIGVEKGCLPAEANHMHTEPFIDKGIVAMDACTAISGIVNCKTIGNVKKLG